MNGPAWQAIMPELVPRDELPAAIALNSVGFNLARAAGPALGGLVVGIFSPGAAFIVERDFVCGCYVLVLYAVAAAAQESATANPGKRGIRDPGRSSLCSL